MTEVTVEESQILKRVTDNWRDIPLDMRQRYWRETNYGEKLPSFELLIEMERSLEARWSVEKKKGHT